MEGLPGSLRGCCKLGDYGQEVRHILCPKRRADRLLTRMNELNRNKDGTLQAAREKTTEQPWLRTHPNVEVWKKSVGDLSDRVDKLDLQGDLPFWRRLCCCYTYALGDKIEQYLEDIKRLEEQRRDDIKDNLVIDVIPIDHLKEKLEDDMGKLRATKRDFEVELSGLETSVAFPPKVKCERVKLWIQNFDSLEVEVSEFLGSMGSAAAATSTLATNPNEVTVAASTSATDSNEAAATDSNEAAATTTTNEAARIALDIESSLKRDIRTMTGKVAEHSDQLKKLKEEGRLVVEAPPSVETLQNGLQDLRVKKKDFESQVLSLERAAVNPRKVSSEGVKSWFGKFYSLEKTVSKLVDSNKSEAATTLENTPNAAAEAVADTSATTSNAAAEVVADTSATTSNAAAEVVADTSATTSNAAATEAIGNTSANTSNAAAVEATHTQQNREMKDSKESVGPAETTSNGVAAATHIQQLVQRVAELSEDLKRLKQEDGLVVEAPPERINELPDQSADFVVGIEENLKKAETLLNDEETKVILIHGMGGSGKTTLVRELTKKLKLPSRGGNGFDFIFSIVVSRNLDIDKIQKDVFVQLGYKRDDPTLPQDRDDRSKLLRSNLNDKGFLLVLDDLWESLGDLPSKLGFQDSSSSSSKKCKVVVTSRKADVCKGRKSVVPLKIELLGREHAWDLFRRKSGLESGLVEFDENIITLAKEIADKCGGLPLLLKTVAGAMVENRDYYAWLIAKNQFNKDPDDIEGMNRVYEVLKFSFDKLENNGLRVCLLYCALFPEDSNIPVDRLIPYLIAEGFVDGKCDFDRHWQKACHDIIQKLKESSLLESGKNNLGEDDDEHVKLHDAVREMLLLLKDEWKVLNCKEEVRRDEHINVHSWDGVSMTSVWCTEHIEKIANSAVTLSSLRTLLVRIPRKGDRFCLPEGFFPQFSSLRILDFSRNRNLSEIPKSIGSLKSLLYLSLEGTCIRELPVEIGNLTKLHTLDLSKTYDVSIPRYAISLLKMLQSLNLSRCNCFEDEKEGMLKVVDVSRGLPKLKDIRLSLFYTIDVDVAERLFPLTSQLSLWHMDIDDVMSSKFLKFQRLKILQLYYVRSRNIILKSPHLCLQELDVVRCNDIEHLGWIRHLPYLTRLVVKDCSNLQELVRKDMSEKNKDESRCRNDDPTKTILSKLKFMELSFLPELKSISSGNLPLPCLTEMDVGGCTKLRSLPIKSSNSVRTQIWCEMEWWESLEWGDDECSSSRFIPDYAFRSI